MQELKSTPSNTPIRQSSVSTLKKNPMSSGFVLIIFKIINQIFGFKVYFQICRSIMSRTPTSISRAGNNSSVASRLLKAEVIFVRVPLTFLNVILSVYSRNVYLLMEEPVILQTKMMFFLTSKNLIRNAMIVHF